MFKLNKKEETIHQSLRQNTRNHNLHKTDWVKIFILFCSITLVCILIKHPWIIFFILVLFTLLLLIYKFTPFLHDITQTNPKIDSTDTIISNMESGNVMKNEEHIFLSKEKSPFKKLSKKELSEYAYTCEMLARKKEKQEWYDSDTNQ